jgi:hypothetical protein
MNRDLPDTAEQDLVIEAARGLFNHLQAIFSELGDHLERKR